MAEVGDDVLVAQSDWTAFFEELKDETDRGCAILAVAWIDHILERKLGALFSGGNSDARRKLFDANGPFSPFSAKVTAAFCLGWLDADLRHDLDVIRKIRNRFAHQIHGLTLDDPDMAILVDSFRLPHREFSDWGPAPLRGEGRRLWDRPIHRRPTGGSRGGTQYFAKFRVSLGRFDRGGVCRRQS